MVASPVLVRHALPSEADALTALAKASKASWGYPVEWLEEWSDALTITEEYIRAAAVFVVESEGRISGMVGLAEGDAGPEIDHLWVAPLSQGQGVGRALLEQARDVAASQGWHSLRVLSDPNAEAFYARAGAVRVGYEAAPVGGTERNLPVLTLSVHQAGES